MAESGCWRGILSTDGQRVVVTALDPLSTDAAAITFVVDNDCIEQCFDRAAASGSAYIAFSKPVPGLTLTQRERWACALTSIVGLGLVQAFLRRRCFYFQPEPHFGSLSTVSRLLLGGR